MSEPTAATLDRSVLAQLDEMTGGDPEFLAEMIDTFIDDGRNLIAEIETSAANGDLPTLRRAAHTLKSNSRTFGASALGDLCQELERHAAAGRSEDAGTLVGPVVAAYPVVVAALTAERPGT